MTDQALERYDPKRLIREAVVLPDDTGFNARDCLFLWLLSLPKDVDPAEAALHLLETVMAGVPEPASPLVRELAAELKDVARYPSARLIPSGRRGRRRGR